MPADDDAETSPEDAEACDANHASGSKVWVDKQQSMNGVIAFKYLLSIVAFMDSTEYIMRTAWFLTTQYQPYIEGV